MPALDSMKTTKTSTTHLTVKVIYLLASFLVYLTFNSATAKNFEMAIDTPNSEEGISQVEILEITQDSKGFIWIGTEDGLNRYDGYEYKVFRPSKHKPHHLAHHRINELLFTQHRGLLVGTPAGLHQYHQKTQSFSRIPLTNRHGNIERNLATISMLEDSSQNLWVGTFRDGLNLLNKNGHQKAQFNISNSKLTSNHIRTLEEDESGNIWVGTTRGLFFFAKNSNTLRGFSEFGLKNEILQSQDIRTLTYHEKKLWVGTHHGLFQIELGIKKLTNYHMNDNSPVQLSDNIINRIVPIDNTGLLLLGTNSGGLNIVDIQKNSVSIIKKKSNLSNSLKSNLIQSLFKDKKNNVWIGTNEGLNKLNLDSNDFGIYRTGTSSLSCPNSNDVFATTIESKGVIWIASFTGGLKRIDTLNGDCETYLDIVSNGQTIALNNVISLLYTKDNRIWIGTIKSGLLYFDLKLKIFKSIPDIPINAKIYALSENKTHVLVSTIKKGFYLIDKKTKVVKEVLHEDNQLSSFTHLYTNSGTLIVAGNKTGLIEISTSGKLIANHFETYAELPKSINDLAESTDYALWIATKGYGAFMLSLRTGEFKHYNLENSNISSNLLWHLEIDKSGKVWFSGSKGLTVYNPETDSFENFTKKDGLQDNPFTPAGDYSLDNDMILTGGINGFNYFSPSEIKLQKYTIRTTITDFEINYIDSEKLRNPSIEAINNSVDLLLPYFQNTLTFRFSGLDYSSPKRINFAYRLKGNQANWTKVGAERRIATFTNLSPGNYIFSVKAANKDGVWSKEETEVLIRIEHPWWQTKLAYILYVAVTILCLYFFIAYRTKMLIQRSQKLEKSVLERTLELAQEKSKVEKLLSRKNEEFANVSHEFRTPLTLILGPLAQVLKTDINEQQFNRLNIVQRNGYRLLRMVDQLLNMETFRIKSITQKSPQAIGKTIELLCDAFADLANEKNISLSLKNKIKLNFDFTPDAFEKILLNLLSNAIKYTKEGGNISVDTSRTKNNVLMLQVSDTGIGIPKDKLDSVFERYNRVLDENSEQVTGAGIGLALVKELVEAHQGRIELESQLGEGTTIRIYLPIINEVQDDQVNQHNTDEIVAMELMSLTNQKVEPEHLDESSNQETNTSLPSVLIIEDNPDMRDYIANSIADDYRILTAKDGEEGLQIAIDEVPDLIISDIMMPKKDGYETTHALRSNEITNHIPIILLTARGDRESRLKGWFEKADEYLTKPFDVEELKIRLKNLLEIRNILKKRFGEAAFDIVKAKTQVEDDSDIETHKNYLQEKFIEQLNGVVEKIYQGTSASVAEMASDLAMSERQLFRKLKSVLDMTPSEYLRRYRLEKARQLLRSGQSASFATFEVGFSSQSYFGKCFKAQFGVSPSEYKRSLAE